MVNNKQHLGILENTYEKEKILLLKSGLGSLNLFAIRLASSPSNYPYSFLSNVGR